MIERGANELGTHGISYIRITEIDLKIPVGHPHYIAHIAETLKYTELAE
jgi:hypothetical protein